jgi:excisionase family DNA binding protein
MSDATPEAAGSDAVATLTVKAAAKELGVSPSLVYALCAAGAIRHERHGLGRRTLRITLAALEEYRRAAAARFGSPAPRGEGPVAGALT